ncbi:DNA-binding response regulator, LytR/AlgR family [Parapedobacter koreensis]|uniref:DNA-binding response regulator, LytR/AlgR family n=2 Tax=Parapedobacter koreensis TaxID=332977 RepID=A0A1H7MF38_9SPHI|nr:DNA-binding response regulator, LytR/AlgR family [Parapedobacter koreensis]
MIYRAIAIDDERFALDDLRLALNYVPNVTLVATFLTFEEALAFLCVDGPMDIIFCDLDLDGTGNVDALRGIAVARELKAWCTLFYFFTGHPEYRIPAIDTSAAGHLLKPVDPAKIMDGVAWLERIRFRQPALPKQLLVRERGSGVLRFVDMEDICCLCTHIHEKNYVEVICHSGAQIVTLASLKAMHARVAPSGLFIQLNQGAVVAKQAIVSESEGIVLLASGHRFAVGKSHAKAFAHYLRQLS